jgi:hypothetical protein
MVSCSKICICGVYNSPTGAREQKCNHCRIPNHILHTVLVPSECYLCELTPKKVCCKCAAITLPSIISKSTNLPTDIILRVLLQYCGPSIKIHLSLHRYVKEARICHTCLQVICTRHQTKFGKPKHPNYRCKDETKCITVSSASKLVHQ